MAPPRPARPALPARPTPPARPAAPHRPTAPVLEHPAPPTRATVSPADAPSTVPTPGLFAGVDRRDFPVARDFLREVDRQSNVAWMAGYLEPAPNVLPPRPPKGQRPRTPARSARGWMEHFVDVRAEGLGVLAVFAGEQSPAVVQLHLSHRPSKRKGEADGAGAVASATLAQLGPGAVIYLDIENIKDPNSIDADTLEYIAAFFSALIAGGYRPGLYTPFQMARGIAATWPGLFVWVVNGTGAFPKPITGDATATPSARDPLEREKVRVFVERPAIEKSRIHLRPKSTTPPDRADNRLAFPVHWQYAVNRDDVTIPVLASGGDLGWDFSTSLVREPSFPFAEPRLALVPGSDRVLALGSLPPARDGAGARTEGDGRCGDLWTPQAAPPSPTTIPAATSTGDRLHPWSRPSVAEPTDGTTTIGVITPTDRPAEIGWSVALDTRWTRAATLAGAGAPAVRPVPGVRVLRFGSELLWFGLGLDEPDAGRVFATRRATSGWDTVMSIGGSDFRAHPNSDLACGQRNANLVDVFVLGADGRLYTLWRSRADGTFPDRNRRQIGGTQVALHPQTSITVVESRTTIDVFVVGMDGLLYTTGWTDRRDWTDLRSIGSRTFLPLVPASVAAVVRGNPVKSTDVFIVDGSGRLATTWRPGGGDWTAGNTRNIGGTQAYPHPLTDIVAVSTTADRIDVTVVADTGAPVRTTWTVATSAWSDLAPVDLPSFVAPAPPPGPTP